MASSKITPFPGRYRLMNTIVQRWRERAPSATMQPAMRRERDVPRSPRSLRGLGAALRHLGDAHAGGPTPFEQHDERAKHA